MARTLDRSRCARDSRGPELHVFDPGEGTAGGGEGAQGPAPAGAMPRPLLTNWFTVVHKGVVIRFVGERWWTADTPMVPYPCTVDPRRPEESFAVRLIDLATGELISPASSAEVAAALKRARAEPGSR